MSKIEQMNITEAIENNIDRSKWVKWKFSDLVNNIVEKVVPKDSGLEHYIGLKHLDTGSLKIRRFGETESLIGNKLKIYKGDLIFAKRNSYLKRVAIADFDAVASAHALVLRPNAENVNPDFLPFFMMSEMFWKRAIEISVGSLSPTINWKALAKQEFLLPPKDQQAQLAKLLWAMDEVIERKIELSDTHTEFYENASLKYLLGKERLIDTDNQLTKTRLGLLPIDWKVVKYKEVAELIHGYQFRDFDFTKKGIPIVKIGEIGKRGELDLSSCSFIEEDRLNEFEEKILRNSDILMALTGATLGKICRVNNLDIPVLQNYRVGRFEPIEGLLDKSFLFHLLSSPIALNQIFGKIHQAAQGNVGKADIEEIRLVLPDLSEQEQIGEVLDAVLVRKDCILEFIVKSKSLQKSLINQVF